LLYILAYYSRVLKSEHMHFRNLTFLLQMTAYLTRNIELDDNLHFTVF